MQAVLDAPTVVARATNPAPRHKLTRGQQIGNYTLAKRLSSGYFSEVWLAHIETLPVVCKFPTWNRASERAFAIFAVIREAVLLGQIHHPRIPRRYELVTHAGVPVLVMQFVPGTRLTKAIAKRSQLSWQEAARYGAELAEALAGVHERGIIHRDIKPGNVMLNGHAHLLDFGISHSWHDQFERPSGVTMTPSYAPWEQLLGHTDARSDVWSLGATIYAMVEGRSPYGASEDTDEILRKARNGWIAPLTAKVPAPLRAALAQCLARNPTHRPTAHEVASLLRATLAAYA